MTTIQDAAASYYAAIDRSDVQHVLGLFADDAVYDRAGVELRGLPAIRQFFSQGRQITGLHVIGDIWCNEANRVVFVTGRFEGQDNTGAAKSFGFADVWRFDTAALVSKRESYLALG